jgi:hypothetical protein
MPRALAGVARRLKLHHAIPAAGLLCCATSEDAQVGMLWHWQICQCTGRVSLLQVLKQQRRLLMRFLLESVTMMLPTLASQQAPAIPVVNSARGINCSPVHLAVWCLRGLMRRTESMLTLGACRYAQASSPTGSQS